ncbi:MAG TPA: ribonuclease E/G [Rhizomicrobium sp.]|nr:ribonuclease E/G [Rhizomicrobium sp.]
MASEILVNVGAVEIRAALIEDGVLEAYAAEPVFGGDARVGDIYLGRVTRVVPALQAAFVAIGKARDGFLSLRDAPAALHEGEAVAVRVTRQAEGEKGARLTARVALTSEQQARRRGARPPALLQAAPGPVEQALRDWKADMIVTDDARWAARLTIELAKDDLFLRHDLEEQIVLLRQRRVPLASGGWIVIEKTEGLTAIDVNSGSFAASGGREETARLVNMEAAHEAARQIRLRGTGGLIVMDFIQMAQGADAVTEALCASLARHPAAVDVLPMNSLGVACMARQHVAAPFPDGSSVEAVAFDIVRAVERASRAAPGREITVRAAPQLVDWLAWPEVRGGLDRRGVGRVRYLAEMTRREDFDVST